MHTILKYLSAIPEGIDQTFIAGCFGLAVTLLSAALTWASDHSITAQRNRLLDSASKHISLWDQWLKVACQLSGSIEKIELDRIGKDMVALAHFLEASSRSIQAEIALQGTECVELTDKVSRLSAWRRWFLLYVPSRSVAWLPRIFFYVGSVLAALYPVAWYATWRHSTGQVTSVGPMGLVSPITPGQHLLLEESLIRFIVRRSLSVELMTIGGTMLFRIISEIQERPALGRILYQTAHRFIPIVQSQSQAQTRSE